MIKKFISIILIPILLLISACSPVEKFNGEIVEGITETKEIKRNEYDLKIENKDSFVLYIYTYGCASCAKFNKKINAFVEESSLLIFKIETSQIKGTIDYHAAPAIAIIKDGNLIDLVNDFDNSKYFESKDSVKKYISKYVNY